MLRCLQALPGMQLAAEGLYSLAACGSIQHLAQMTAADIVAASGIDHKPAAAVEAFFAS